MTRYLLFLAAFGLTFCFGYQPATAQAVYTDFNTKVDFSKYKTYAWLAPGDSVLNGRRRDKLYGGYIMHAANQELQAKGMVVDTQHPDVIFIFNTQVGDRIEYTQTGTLSIGVGVAGPGYYVGGSAPVAGGEIKSTEYTDGILSFDMYDTTTRKLVWSGGAKKSFKSTDDVEKIISDYTKKIFKKLPIKK